MIAELAKLKARVGHGGATATAADYILSTLAHRKNTAPRPHFAPGMVVASSDLPAPEVEQPKAAQ